MSLTLVLYSLGAYYTYLHIYFPVLPPPPSYPVVDSPKNDIIFSKFKSSSPLSLAISATLALIPPSDDPDPSSSESITRRREQAQAFAHSAIDSIEMETELLESSIEPSEALSSFPIQAHRKNFHPGVRLELESIAALLVLSTYEYGQRGNIAKMRNRAGQALIAAMDMGLHSRIEENEYSEGDRRIWWMTVCPLDIFVLF